MHVLGNRRKGRRGEGRGGERREGRGREGRGGKGEDGRDGRVRGGKGGETIINYLRKHKCTEVVGAMSRDWFQSQMAD